MLAKLLNKIFSSHNDRMLLRIGKIVDNINKIEVDMEKLSDRQLADKTIEFRVRIAQGETINSLLPEAFAVVREASKRVFGMRHFDVQLLGGIVLNERCIAEMRTGEGKTLTATLPAYLNSLSGKGVHIVTVNDYLAQRDAKNNRPLFQFLGLTVGINLPGLPASAKRAAYSADITYGTNNEYGFDYLRDNMAFSSEDRVQRKLNYALVDEVDSILIDEARTPLIISGPTEDNSELYYQIDKLIPHLTRQDKEDSDVFQGIGHFSVDEKSRQINLTERGLVLIENLMVKAGIMTKGDSLYSSSNIMLMYHVNAALRAHVLFARDVDYLVKDGKVLIVDEHTGRAMPGRRWSDGLHQAIEAKENLLVQNENQTLASITFQNYFRLYAKLAGMTGTASTEAFEFSTIYKLDTVIVPTNRPMIRKDLPDLVYMTEHEKINAIIEDIKSCIKRSQPVLVGTISIEKSEVISHALNKVGITHKVLNAKFHAMEADIVAQAGQPGAVTIATNMAGRGTDIVLGGSLQSELAALGTPDQQNIADIKTAWQKRHDAVLAAGGLHIIGTERHESRRIDNQLRGRSGRQGDVGSSRFYLSMEDALMRIFASDRITGMMRKLGMKTGEAIEHQLVTKAIANAQHKVESHNFNVRKQLLEYDDVTNDQRCAIYSQRNEVLDVKNINETIASIYEDVFKKIIDNYIPLQSLEEIWDIHGLEQLLKNDFYLNIPITQWFDNKIDLHKEILRERVLVQVLEQYQRRKEIIGDKIMCNLEKNIMLTTLDSLWKEHLAAMEYLRQGIHLRCYAQKDPKQEYKRESFAMFTAMLNSLKYEVVSILSKIQVNITEETGTVKQQYCKNLEYLAYQQQFDYQKLSAMIQMANSARETKYKVGRNDPCPCKSGKKFKHCHFKL